MGNFFRLGIDKGLVLQDGHLIDFDEMYFGFGLDW